MCTNAAPVFTLGLKILLSGRNLHLQLWKVILSDCVSVEMLSDTGRPSRQSNTLKLPIAFSSLAVIAIILLSYVYRDAPVPQVHSLKRPAAEDAAVFLEDPEPHNLTLYRRLDPYSCTKDIPCHTVACCENPVFYSCSYSNPRLQAALSSGVTLAPAASATHSAAPTASASVMRNQNAAQTPTPLARLVL